MRAGRLDNGLDITRVELREAGGVNRNSGIAGRAEQFR
jgi:hypothetical protein